jgi:hypothetical protein
MPTEDECETWEAFCYPNDPQVYGAFERAMPEEYRRLIAAKAGAVRAASRTLLDCRLVTSLWEFSLRGESRIQPVSIAGGEGVDYDDPLVPQGSADSRLSGYLMHDGRVGCHYWLLVGSQGFVFDPTARQPMLSGEWPLSLDSYLIDGRTLTVWRGQGS